MQFRLSLPLIMPRVICIFLYTREPLGEENTSDKRM